MQNSITVIPRLPYINLEETRDFYINHLLFNIVNYHPNYLVMKKNLLELHFFHFPDLDPLRNYAMVYLRMTEGIDELYADFISRNVPIHPNGSLEIKPWGMKEFAILDPNHTLLTFGQLFT